MNIKTILDNLFGSIVCDGKRIPGSRALVFGNRIFFEQYLLSDNDIIVCTDYTCYLNLRRRNYKHVDFLPEAEVKLLTLSGKLYNYIERKYDVKKFDLVVSNPPYDGDLHLRILNEFLKIGKKCVFIHPARWMEDVLAQYKAKSATGKKFEHLKTALEKAYLIKSRDADHVFHILNNQDMIIGVYSDSDLNPNVPIYDDSKQFFDVLKRVISYAHDVKSLGDVVEDNLIDGIRVEVKGILPILNHVDSELVKGYPVRVVWNVISIDGYTEDGQFWANANKRNTKTHGKKIGTPIPHSIRFSSVEDAQIFIDIYQTNVVKNIIYMLKYDQHSGHTHIPYFDPKTIKTEDDVLDALGITEPEYREWLKRKVDDYREKDFIKYNEWIDC